MERDRLLELAPHYYTIAICSHFDVIPNKIASATTLWTTVTGMKNGPLFWFVLRNLVEKKMLEAMEDNFGPTIYTRTETFTTEWEALKKQPNTPYYKFALDPRGEHCL